jgi:hypothetical protein
MLLKQEQQRCSQYLYEQQRHREYCEEPATKYSEHDGGSPQGSCSTQKRHSVFGVLKTRGFHDLIPQSGAIFDGTL